MYRSIQKSKTKCELAKFYHDCLCSPVLTTIQNAIRNDRLISWPGNNSINFPKFVTDTQAIDMGHLDQERQNLQSTRPQSSKKSTIITTVPNITPLDKTFEVLSMIVPFSAKSRTYGDSTGAFPYTASRGAKYIYIMYDYDGNAILTEALKSRQAHEITNTWERMYEIITKHGHPIKHYILDNEFSHELKKALLKRNIEFQLAPPNTHKRNAAERSIRTFKSHFYLPLRLAILISQSPNGIDFCNKVKDVELTSSCDKTLYFRQ